MKSSIPLRVLLFFGLHSGDFPAMSHGCHGIIHKSNSRVVRSANLVTLPTRDIESSSLAIRGGGDVSVNNQSVLDFLKAIDLFGTSVFAFSGAVTAGSRGMDLLGMSIIATITAVGGGTVRDILLDSGPVFWIENPIYIEICVFTAISTFLLWPILEKQFGWKDSALPICYADAVSIGVFAVVGTQKGIDLNLAPTLWIVCGLLTATFGGITRDIICQQRPRVMYPHRSLYAPPVIIGSAVYALLFQKAGVNAQTAAYVSVLVTFCSRVLSFNHPRRLPHWKNTEALKVQ